MRLELHAFRRHAINTAQIAAVRDRDPHIVVNASKRVCQQFHGGGTPFAGHTVVMIISNFMILAVRRQLLDKTAILLS
ncbi:hypothetical protein D3C71_1574400 [compost metagenome]